MSVQVHSKGKYVKSAEQLSWMRTVNIYTINKKSRCSSQFARRLPLYSLPRTWNKFTKHISDFNTTYKRLFKIYIFNGYSIHVRCSNTHCRDCHPKAFIQLFIICMLYTLYLLTYIHITVILSSSVLSVSQVHQQMNHQFVLLSLVLHGSLSVSSFTCAGSLAIYIYIYVFFAILVPQFSSLLYNLCS